MADDCPRVRVCRAWLAVGVAGVAGLFGAAGMGGCESLGMGGGGSVQPVTVQEGYQPEPRYDAQKARMERLGDNQFRVSVKEMRATVPVQKNPQWCWAACAQAVLEQAGYQDRRTGKRYDQEELIRSLAEFRQTQAATADEALLALTPEMWQQYSTTQQRMVERRGRPPNNGIGYGWSQPKPPTPLLDALVDELAAGGPALVGTSTGGGTQPVGGVLGGSGEIGHVVLAREVEFAKAVAEPGSGGGLLSMLGIQSGGGTPAKHYYVTKIVAVDPMDGREVTISGAELERVRFAGGRAVSLVYIKNVIDGMGRARWEHN